MVAGIFAGSASALFKPFRGGGPGIGTRLRNKPQIPHSPTLTTPLFGSQAATATAAALAHLGSSSSVSRTSSSVSLFNKPYRVSGSGSRNSSIGYNSFFTSFVSEESTLTAQGKMKVLPISNTEPVALATVSVPKGRPTLSRYVMRVAE